MILDGVTLVCSRYGKTNGKGKTSKKKLASRCGCPSYVRIRRVDGGMYKIPTVCNLHNHEFFQVSLKKYMRSCKNTSEGRK